MVGSCNIKRLGENNIIFFCFWEVVLFVIGVFGVIIWGVVDFCNLIFLVFLVVWVFFVIVFVVGFFFFFVVVVILGFVFFGVLELLDGVFVFVGVVVIVVWVDFFLGVLVFFVFWNFNRYFDFFEKGKILKILVNNFFVKVNMIVFF